MYLTEDTQPHYGRLPGVHKRATKKIYYAYKTYYDGEDATMAITIGTMAQREAFVDSLPDEYEVDGIECLEEDFKEWLTFNK